MYTCTHKYIAIDINIHIRYKYQNRTQERHIKEPSTTTTLETCQNLAKTVTKMQ